MVVRRLPWAAAGVVLAVAVTALVGCGSNATGPGVTTVDTLPAFVIYTGTMLNTFGVTNFLGSSEIQVGDIDSTNPGVTERGVVTFYVNGFEGDTALTAVLRLDECYVSGAPFANSDTVLVERLLPAGTPPGRSQNTGIAYAGYGPITTSPDTGFVYDTVTSALASDLADSAVFSQFRLRFSQSTALYNGVSDYVSFRTVASGNCQGNTAGQPVLILTAKTQ
jgi:hypothetical protein